MGRDGLVVGGAALVAAVAVAAVAFAQLGGDDDPVPTDDALFGWMEAKGYVCTIPEPEDPPGRACRLDDDHAPMRLNPTGAAIEVGLNETIIGLMGGFTIEEAIDEMEGLFGWPSDASEKIPLMSSGQLDGGRIEWGMSPLGDNEESAGVADFTNITFRP